MHYFTTRIYVLPLHLDRLWTMYIYVSRATSLLGLATVTGLLGGLDASSVGLGSTGFTSQRFHQSTGGFEWSCEIALGLLTPDVELGRVGLEDGLDSHQ